MYEHRYLENIKKLYKYAVECDYHQQYKAIIESAIVSTPEEFNYKLPLSLDKSELDKKTSARKSPRQFSNVFDIKQKMLSAG